MTDLSILFVNYNSWRFLVRALESLESCLPLQVGGHTIDFEIIVVDNDSPQRDEGFERQLGELLGRMNGRLIMHDENGGYAKGMNLAYQHCSGSHVLVSNPDVSFSPGCIEGMIEYIDSHPDAGVTAPEIYVDRGMTCRLPPNILPTIRDLWATTLVAVSPDYVAKYSAERTAKALRVWTATEPVDLEQVSGCCFVMTRTTIDKIGFFDPRFPLYYEDTDLSMRIRGAGLRMVEVTGAKLVHFYDRSGQTNHEEAMRRYWVSRRTFYRKWYGPAGGWFFDFTRWFLDTKWMHKLGARFPQPGVRDLPSAFEAPTIQLSRRMSKFLVEVSMDPRFYLAAATFGSGDEWTPPQTLLECFGPTTYYFRILDLDGETPEQVGIYRFTRVYPEKPEKREKAASA